MEQYIYPSPNIRYFSVYIVSLEKRTYYTGRTREKNIVLVLSILYSYTGKAFSGLIILSGYLPYLGALHFVHNFILWTSWDEATSAEDNNRESAAATVMVTAANADIRHTGWRTSTKKRERSFVEISLAAASELWTASEQEHPKKACKTSLILTLSLKAPQVLV